MNSGLGRAVRCAVVLVAATVLCAYVVPADKVLERWGRERKGAFTEGGVEVPITWSGRPGRLYVGGPGRNALAVEGDPTAFDGGAGAEGSLGSLWLALDLWAVTSPEELPPMLERAGVDLARAGYARSPWTKGGIACTVGARGEGEPGLAQVWFDRSGAWPCRAALPGLPAATIGPLGPSGWPGWIRVGEDRLLEVVGVPVAAGGVPDWARRPVASPGETFPNDWRRAFGGPEP